MTRLRGAVTRRYCADCGEPLRLRLVREGGRASRDPKTGRPKLHWVRVCRMAIQFGERQFAGGVLYERSWHDVKFVWRQSKARRRVAARMATKS